jgi:nitrogenase molybdenum-iron protein alpha/beta subunit
VDPRLVEAYANKRQKTAKRSVQLLSGDLSGQRVAVFADLPLAAGLCSLLDELGMNVVLVGIRGNSLGGSQDLSEALGRYGVPVSDELRIIEQPSIRQAADLVWELYSEGELDGVICSATELNGITRVFSDHVEDVDPNGARGLFYVEMGFPSQQYHTVVPQPFMGYGGTVSLMQRIYDAPRLLDLGRLQPR